MKPQLKLKQLSHAQFVEEITSSTEDDLKIVLSSYANHRGAWTCGKREIPDHILWFVDKGEIQGEVHERPVVIKPRTFHWISAGTPHSLHLVGSPPFSVFALRFQLKKKGFFLRLKEDRIAIESLPRLRRVMDMIYVTLRFRSPFWFLKFRSLLMVLVIDALEELEGHHDLSSSEFSTSELKAMTHYLEQHSRDKITPRDLADFFHLSLDYFSRKFHRQFKVSPRRWLRDEQIRSACSLLCETTSSIKEISYGLGYDDQRFFSRQFKRVVGMTPSEYRSRH